MPTTRWKSRPLAGRYAGKGAEITDAIVIDALQKRVLLYDKAGEEHYNLISALHKSVRNSDPDAALYWLGRMLEAGEDPLYIARRVVRMAVEDIGLADPGALALCMAARDAVDFIGMPEGNLALAQAVVYLSVAPKSNALYTAYSGVLQDVEQTAAEPVPLHLRNAPTGLMKGMGYGQGYKYAHDLEDKVADMQCLPDNLRDRSYYQPTNEGMEKRIRERMEEIKRRRLQAQTCLIPIQKNKQGVPHSFAFCAKGRETSVPDPAHRGQSRGSSRREKTAGRGTARAGEAYLNVAVGRNVSQPQTLLAFVVQHTQDVSAIGRDGG